MLHLINKLRGFRHQVNDLVLVALPVHGTHERVLGGQGQELGNWLDWKVDCHDLTVLLDFDIARVLLEEDVAVFGGERFDHSFHVD
jgi:hypothetical protein